MSTLHSRLSAMSMVEVMIACSVLVVGIGAGMGAIGNSGITSNRRQNVDRALAEIQSQMESFQAMDDRSLQTLFAGGDTLFFPVTGLSPGTDPETKLRMSKPLKVQRVAVTTGTVRLTTLRFVASWQDASGPGWVEQFFHYTERR